MPEIDYCGPILLKSVLKNYSWGQIGDESIVYRMAKNQRDSSELSSSEHYAELWLGCHRDGEALVVGTDELLSLFTAKKPSYRFRNGEDNWKGISSHMPTCILKVLGIRRPLSLQVHPTEDQAEQLFKTGHPDIKDPRHKPEIAIAISDEFHVFCGFEDEEIIRRIFFEFSAFSKILEDHEIRNQDALYRLCLKLLTDNELTKDIRRDLLEKASNLTEGYCFLEPPPLTENSLLSNKLELLSYLENHFPGDNGILAALLLKRRVLKKGQGIFLPAGIIHSYIYGDCVEVMAPSDNVLRGGLTPKAKDPDMLYQVCLFQPLGTEMIIPKLSEKCPALWTYKTPAEEFSVKRIEAKHEDKIVVDIGGVSALGIVTEGTVKIYSNSKAIELPFGSTFLTPAEPNLEISGHGTLFLATWGIDS
eukprot:GHVP01039429.1.p1 GENE.GHVP01039429.1~~GHVP01039429.1.p1  ORF type:complete len:419 (-),score=75.12 GHVP01039429.1:964-2220(-)